MRLALLVLVACHASPRPDVRVEIERAIDAEMVANRTKDIDAFMANLDETFVLLSNEPGDAGRTIDKAAMRADILRDWGVIAEMVDVRRWITAMGPVTDTSAVVFTDQRYERTMHRPDPSDPTLDRVVTTQRHEEHWVRRPTGWKITAIKELGGEILVNGKPYVEPK